ncbi:unnamed protein product [Urochloa humidicola]
MPERRGHMASAAGPSGDRGTRRPATSVKGSGSAVHPRAAAAAGLCRACLLPAPSSTSRRPSQLPLQWRNSPSAQIGDLDIVAALSSPASPWRAVPLSTIASPRYTTLLPMDALRDATSLLNWHKQVFDKMLCQLRPSC